MQGLRGRCASAAADPSLAPTFEPQAWTHPAAPTQPSILSNSMAASPASSAAAGGPPPSEPWSLPEFLRERVQLGRRLLVEDARYEGSTDLQVRRRSEAPPRGAALCRRALARCGPAMHVYRCPLCMLCLQTCAVFRRWLGVHSINQSPASAW